MTTAQDPIAHAARLLREAAEELRQAHAYNCSEGWENETDAKEAYDEHIAAAQALEDWEAAVGAGGVQPLRSILEGCKVVPLEPTQEMLAALMSPGEAEALASSPSETFALMLMDRAGIRERYSAMLGAAPDASTAPQQGAQEPCPTCAALARAVMCDQVSFDRKPDCYGIRQITDDESVEEWEDIRTSPDVAREEANDMMATGRGEIYEVVPLYAAPQPAPAPVSDEVVRDAAFEAVRKKLCTLPRYSFVLDDDGLVRRAPDRTGNWIEFDEAHALFDPVSVEAALAAQGGE